LGGAARYGDLVCVGRGDGFGGGATDAMSAVGTEVAAVIEGGFDRVAGVEGWPVRRCRVRGARGRAMPADGPAGTHSALRRRLGLVMTCRSGWRSGAAAAGGGVSRRA